MSTDGCTMVQRAAHLRARKGQQGRDHSHADQPGAGHHPCEVRSVAILSFSLCATGALTCL